MELLAADFTAASQEVMQQMIGWRYKMQQSKLALMQASLADVYALVSAFYPAESDCTQSLSAGWASQLSCSMPVLGSMRSR